MEGRGFLCLADYFGFCSSVFAASKRNVEHSWPVIPSPLCCQAAREPKRTLGSSLPSFPQVFVVVRLVRLVK